MACIKLVEIITWLVPWFDFLAVMVYISLLVFFGRGGEILPLNFSKPAFNVVVKS